MVTDNVLVIFSFFFSKNYTTGRLTEGFLQLSNKTHLVIDETDLKPGRLDNKGINIFISLVHIKKKVYIYYIYNKRVNYK